MRTIIHTMVLGAAMVVFSVPASHGAPPPMPRVAQSVRMSQARSTQLRQMETRIRLMQEQMRRFRQSGNSEQRSALLREHMRTMLGTMRMMRAMGGERMYGMMGEGGMGGGMMEGRMMGQGMRGQGMRRGANSRATPRAQRRWMQDRLDIMQMMMEQMMDQMQAMEAMGMGGSGHGEK